MIASHALDKYCLEQQLYSPRHGWRSSISPRWMWLPSESAVPACGPPATAGMRRYRFRALVRFGTAAREGCAPGPATRAGALTIHACCLLQPFFYCEYFPAVIYRDEGLTPLQPGGHAVPDHDAGQP